MAKKIQKASFPFRLRLCNESQINTLLIRIVSIICIKMKIENKNKTELCVQLQHKMVIEYLSALVTTKLTYVEVLSSGMVVLDKNLTFLVRALHVTQTKIWNLL